MGLSSVGLHHWFYPKDLWRLTFVQPSIYSLLWPPFSVRRRGRAYKSRLSFEFLSSWTSSGTVCVFEDPRTISYQLCFPCSKGLGHMTDKKCLADTMGGGLSDLAASQGDWRDSHGSLRPAVMAEVDHQREKWSIRAHMMWKHTLWGVCSVSLPVIQSLCLPLARQGSRVEDEGRRKDPPTTPKVVKSRLSWPIDLPMPR